jgi:hypothetical protein
MMRVGVHLDWIVIPVGHGGVAPGELLRPKFKIAFSRERQLAFGIAIFADQLFFRVG